MMILRYSSTSPFVRKVSVTVIECGLENQVQPLPTNPWAADTDLPSTNPLGKVPALTLETGQVLFDSPVICEYLDSLNSSPKLFPSNGQARWTALRQQAIGDGIMDAAIGRILESRRPSELQSAAVADRFQNAVERSLDLLESQADELANGFTIGQATVACALEYLDFRFASDNWRDRRSDLAGWYESVASRPSVQQTIPHE